MFLDEARLASAISHRNVCNVFDFGETDGRFYIAMDFLSGQSLRDVLRRLRKTDLQMEPRRVAVYMAYMIAEACEGLHAAHELHGAEGQPLNVVHRDVSPHNLFITYDGNTSVVDFGIARASDRIQTTATGVLKGKFSYMAPEQMRQLDIDRRADIWALGVVLWESLLLRRLFVRSSQADTVMSVMMDRVKPPSELNPDVPKELDTIVLRAISRNPAHRFPTAREMGRELMKFCRESGVMCSPIEIEHLMERLFAKEIADSKLLMRKAKHSNTESGVWMEVTPSGFARVPMRSGTVEKGQFAGSSPPGEPGEEARRSVVITQNSQVAPRAEAAATAHPSKSKRLLWVGALAACALVGGAVIALRGPSAEPIAATSSSENLSSQGSQVGAALATTAPASSSSEGPQNSQPPPRADEQATAPSPNAAPTPAPRPAVVSRPDPRRVDPRAQRAAPGKQAQSASARESDNQDHNTRTVGADDLAIRGAEPAASAALPAPEPREEAPAPAPAPVPLPVQAAPAPQVAPRAVSPAAPTPAPAAPQKLDAQVAIADLDVEGSLGSSIVLRMLSRATSGIHSCYVDAAKRAGRNDFSALSVNFVIDEGGAVRQLTMGKHGLSDLPGCAANTLKRLRSERVPDVGTAQAKFLISFKP
jgi:serine/threonine-protein kinase